VHTETHALVTEPSLSRRRCPCVQGTPDAPRCGFSRKVVDALQQCAADFGSFDILSDEAVRQGLKVSWSVDAVRSHAPSAHAVHALHAHSSEMPR
jgi:hypothetical protein